MNSHPDDQSLVCKDCGSGFIHPVSEQLLFSERNCPAPVRCGNCRHLRRQKRERFEGHIPPCVDAAV